MKPKKKAASVTKSAKGAKSKPRQARVYSTSEARANFAENLETAKTKSAIIGFGRYGATIAALVPVEAVYILAGAGAKVSPDKRKQIGDEARLFIDAISNDAEAAKPASKASDRAVPRKRRGRARG